MHGQPLPMRLQEQGETNSACEAQKVYLVDMKANDYATVHLRMAVHVTAIEEAEQLYIVTGHVDRSDQTGGQKIDFKMGLSKGFVDSLDRNDKADLIRHEMSKRLFDGLGAS